MFWHVRSLRKFGFGFIVSAAMTGVCAAETETIIIKPGACAQLRDGYLLAANSGAVIRRFSAEEGEGVNDTSHVIVFRPRPLEGWASQRILRRFDLKLDGVVDTVVINSGGFCSQVQSR